MRRSTTAQSPAILPAYSEVARLMLDDNNDYGFEPRCKETSRFRCYSLSWISPLLPSSLVAPLTPGRVSRMTLLPPQRVPCVNAAAQCMTKQKKNDRHLGPMNTFAAKHDHDKRRTPPPCRVAWLTEYNEGKWKRYPIHLVRHAAVWPKITRTCRKKTTNNEGKP
jgi:hypothetical protein